MKLNVKAHSIPLVCMTLLAASCAPKQQEPLNEVYFTDNSIVYDWNDITPSDTLRSEVILDELMGISRLLVVDSIICCPTSDLPYKFALYSISGDSLASVGLLGNGPDDFANNGLNGVIDRYDGEVGVWVVDVNNAMLKRLNLSKTIASGKSTVDSAIRIPGYTVDAFSIGDKLIYPHMANGTFNLHISDGENSDSGIYDEPMYLKDFGQALFSAYHSKKSISSDGKYLVNPMMAINQVNILNLDYMSRLAVSIGNVAKQDDVLADHLPARCYYTALTLSDDNIFALYNDMPGKYTMKDYETHPRQLHIFGYDGKLKGVFPFDKIVYDIAYSKIDNSLYALTSEEEICRYSLPDFNK